MRDEIEPRTRQGTSAEAGTKQHAATRRVHTLTRVTDEVRYRGARIFIGEVARPPPDLGLAPEVFYAFQAPRDRPDGAGAA